MTDEVKVSAHDLHRLLLEFRAQLKHGDHRPAGYWHHAVDYDKSFERLADIIDARLIAAGLGPDSRTRCQHDNPVYGWPDGPVAVTWVNIRSPRLRHLAGGEDRLQRFKALCGLTFVDEDMVDRPSAPYQRCDVCLREQRLRGNVHVVKAVAW